MTLAEKRGEGGERRVGLGHDLVDFDSTDGIFESLKVSAKCRIFNLDGKK